MPLCTAARCWRCTGIIQQWLMPHQENQSLKFCCFSWTRHLPSVLQSFMMIMWCIGMSKLVLICLLLEAELWYILHRTSSSTNRGYQVFFYFTSTQLLAYVCLQSSSVMLSLSKSRWRLRVPLRVPLRVHLGVPFVIYKCRICTVFWYKRRSILWVHLRVPLRVPFRVHFLVTLLICCAANNLLKQHLVCTQIWVWTTWWWPCIPWIPGHTVQDKVIGHPR